MSKRVLVLGSLSTDIGEDEALERMRAFMAEALDAERTDTSVAFCHIDQLGFVANNDTAEIIDLRNDVNLREYDMVFFRGKLRFAINDVSLVSWYLQKTGIPSLNSAYSNRRATGKVPQLFQMHELGMSIPYSVSASNDHLPRLIDQHLSYPVVVKDIHGGHGNNNFLVHSNEELQKVLTEHSDIRFVAQEFIPNDCDYRVLLVGPKELIIRRQAEGESHLNNTSQGGSATIVPSRDFPADIIKQSRAYAEYCKYELAGVDVMFDKNTNKPYFLEINSQPQIATGAFVPEKTKLVGEYFRSILGD
jgi:glutathione synthase/RimK-type ligase-like ATP-grasp enzyme